MNEKALSKMFESVEECSNEIVNTIVNEYLIKDYGEVGELIESLSVELERLTKEKLIEVIGKL